MLLKLAALTFQIYILWHMQGYDNKKHSNEEDGGGEHTDDNHQLATFLGSSGVPEIRHTWVAIVNWIYAQKNKCELKLVENGLSG